MVQPVNTAVPPLFRPPPPKDEVFPLMVQSVSVIVPSAYPIREELLMPLPPLLLTVQSVSVIVSQLTMPPPLPLTEFPSIVQPVSVTVPDRFQIPPPLLPLTVQSVSVMVP